MASWLVLDLRDNQCAVGLLTVRENGPPGWLAENVLYPYVSATDRDARKVAALAFFRRPKERLWQPALGSVLSDPALTGHDTIPALLDEPAGQLPDLLAVTLGILLRSALAQYPEVPLLALHDRPLAQEPLHDFLNLVQREISLVVSEGPSAAYAGFALWDTAGATVPQSGARWLCALAANESARPRTGAAESEPQHKYRSYTWKRTRFSVKTVGSAPANAQDLHTFSSASELERVGAAIYALLWREALLQLLDVDIETLEKELAAQSQLLAQLQTVYEGLRSGAARLLGPRGTGRGPAGR